MPLGRGRGLFCPLASRASDSVRGLVVAILSKAVAYLRSDHRELAVIDLRRRGGEIEVAHRVDGNHMHVDVRDFETGHQETYSDRAVDGLLNGGKVMGHAHEVLVESSRELDPVVDLAARYDQRMATVGRVDR